MSAATKAPPSVKSVRRQLHKKTPVGRRDFATDFTPSPGESEKLADVPVDKILPHPMNPRKTFEAAALRELADSMKKVDLLQRVLLRPHPDQRGYFQLLGGERRWRAAKSIKWETIPASVRSKISDVDALTILLTENLERTNLNEIELAGALESFTLPVSRGGAGWTLDDAAKFYKRSESWAKNLVRLLRLPAAWMKRVISGEVPQTFARLLLPYLDAGEVMKQIDKAYSHDHANRESRYWNYESWKTRDNFEESVMQIADEFTRQVDPKHHDSPKFKIDAATRKQLRVIVLPIGADGKPETRAQNVGLWDELQEEAIRTKAAKPTKVTKAAAAKPQTAAEKKEFAAAEKQRTADRAKQLKNWVASWRVRLLRYLIAEKIEPGDWQCHKFFTYYATRPDYRQPLGLDVDSVIKGGRGERWKTISKFYQDYSSPLDANDELIGQTVRRILWNGGKSVIDFPAPSVPIDGLAADYEINLADYWIVDGDPELDRFRKDFFSLHTIPQLTALCKELKVEPAGAKTKAALVDRLIESHAAKATKLPKSIAKVGRG